MGYTAGFTAVTGATYTAAQYNTNVRDNFAAIWVFSAAGDLIYATSAITAAKLALGTAGQLLRVNAGATAPEWATVDMFPAGGTAYQGVRQNSGASAKEWASLISVLGRKGGSGTIWNNAGSSDYTPDNALVQCGAVSVSMSGSSPAVAGPITINFPVAFAYAPLLFFSLATGGAGFSSGVWTQLEYNNLTASGFDLYLAQNAGSGYYNPRIVNWLAIGPK